MAESEKPAPPQELQSRIFEALVSSTSQRAPGKSFSSLDGVVTENETNKYDLLCPREACASVILKADVAKLVVREHTEQMDSPDHPLPSPLTALTATSWWLVEGSPMLFENISFSRPTKIGTSSENKKLLLCADCELGPLGWSVLGSTQHWLALERVNYREV